MLNFAKVSSEYFLERIYFGVVREVISARYKDISSMSSESWKYFDMFRDATRECEHFFVLEDTFYEWRDKFWIFSHFGWNSSNLRPQIFFVFLKKDRLR